MIKQNLLLNKGTSAAEVVDFELENSLQGGASNIEQKELIKKGLTALVFTALLFAFESYNIGILNDKMMGVQKKIQAADMEIKKHGNVSEEAALQKQKKEELEKKIQVIKNLARSRITALKALDFIQNIIPTKVWLSELNLESETIIFEGFAISEEELNKFLSQIEGRKNYFTDVIMEKSEDKQTKQGSLKAFIISSKLVVEK